MSEEESSGYDISESITYYYDTASYDFNQYESTDDHNPTQGVHRDFEYNKSIGTTSHADENESIDLKKMNHNFTAASLQND